VGGAWEGRVLEGRTLKGEELGRQNSRRCGVEGVELGEGELRVELWEGWSRGGRVLGGRTLGGVELGRESIGR